MRWASSGAPTVDHPGVRTREGSRSVLWDIWTPSGASQPVAALNHEEYASYLALAGAAGRCSLSPATGSATAISLRDDGASPGCRLWCYELVDEGRQAVKAMAVIQRPSDGALLVSEYSGPESVRFHRLLGDHVEFGEHAADTIRREFLEEIGQALVGVQLLGCRGEPIPVARPAPARSGVRVQSPVRRHGSIRRRRAACPR